MKNKIIVLLIGISASFNTMAQWDVKHVNINGGTIYEIKFINNEVGFAMGANGLILKSSDAGESWVNKESDIIGLITEFEFISLDTLFLLAFESIDGEVFERIYKTIDSGETWELVFQINDRMESLSFLNSDIGFISGSEKILMTTNSGEDWNTVYKTIDDGYEWGSVLDLEMINDSIGFAVSHGKLDSTEWIFQSSILKTYDGGETWDEIVQSDKWLHTLDFLDEEFGFISGYDNNFRTTDSGLSWDTLNNLTSVVHIFVSSENTIYTVNHPTAYAGENPISQFAISKSIDQGETWDGGFTDGAHLESVHFINDSTGFVAGDFSIIMKTENCGGEITGDYPWDLFTNLKEVPILKLKIFPNPVTNELHIESFDEYYNWNYRIESVNGMRFKNGILEKSMIEVSNLPNGIYHLILNKGSAIKIGRFVKL